MDTNKNSYTIVYSIIMVVVVAAVLAFASSALKERQQSNIDMETQKTILASVNLVPDLETAADRAAYVKGQYTKYINAFIVNSNGERMEGDAFKVNLAEQNKKIMSASAIEDPETRAAELAKVQLPVFECRMDDGRTVNILPIYGAGLWGPIWGYVALESDNRTIYGATFAHKGETPGLGAEIATEHFQKQFRGKKIYDKDVFTSVIVAKGGAAPGTENEVDAISGGTITSRALENSIRNWVKLYTPYLNSNTVSACELQPAETTVPEETTVEE